MLPLRSADGSGVFVLIAIIWFVVNVVGRAGKAAAKRGGTPSGRVADGDSPGGAAESQGEFSLESILKQIEAVKRQKEQGRGALAPPARVRPAPPTRPAVVQDYRGPLGRVSKTSLPDAEEVEDRTSLEDEGRAVEERRLQYADRFEERPERVVQNRDDEAAAIAARRIQQAEARNRPHAMADHAGFDKAIREGEPTASTPRRLSVRGLRDALVWREILGPPKALQDE